LICHVERSEASLLRRVRDPSIAEKRSLRVTQNGLCHSHERILEVSRVRWTTFVREQAEAHGFAWAYWELAAGFGVYDPDAKAWREDLLKALIP